MPSVFQTLFTRPGVRAAAGNFGWLAAEKAARLLLNVGVGFWVARYLGPGRFGELSYALALVGIAALLAELGLDGLVRRELIRRPDRASALLATAGGLRLAGGALAWGLVLLAATAGAGGEPGRILLPVLGLTLFQPALLVADLHFQARLEARFSVAAQLAALAVGAAVRVALIRQGAPLVAFAWAAVAELAVAAAVLGGLAWARGLRLVPARFDRRLAAELLRGAWPLLLSGFAVGLYLRVDVVMLTRLAGEREAGVYAAAVRFTEIWYFVPVALASSLLPSVLRARAAGPAAYARRLQAAYDLNAGLAYALAVPLAFLAPWVVRAAYGAAYADAAPVLAVHIWSSVFVFLGVARGQFLVNEGHTRFYLCATLAGLLTNVGLNLALIPRHGAAGAALATLAGQAVAAWLTSFCFAPARAAAWMQARALLIPFRWFRYVRAA
ncbi:MAG: flippase [Opitutaceae bacterium]|nr:flippase [Opitutaceae bacterium]